MQLANLYSARRADSPEAGLSFFMNATGEQMRLLIVFALTTAALQAQEFGRGGRGGPEGGYMRTNPIARALDADHNGVISADEIANSPVALRTLDRSGDGAIGYEELLPPRPDGSDELVQTLMAFDKNHDGKISKDELPERIQGLLERGDTNHDGFLTVDEIRAVAKAQAAQSDVQPEGEGREGRGPRPDPLFNALDRNRDGTISADEIARAPESLKTLDRNSDGQLTEDELRPAPFQGRGRGGNPDEMLTRLFSQFDKNNDGKISREEAAGGPLEDIFDRADRNNDGFLTRDELRTALQQRRGPNGPPQR
jgi:Ca2+-binding EF-hand superfamily protein